jgi:hypothetical protein
VARRRVVIHDDWEPLSDDAIVVRGGRMANEDLALNLASVFLESKLTGLCGGAAEPPLAAEAILAQLEYDGNWLCESRLGRLRAHGADVVMVNEIPKCVILLKVDELGDDWVRSPARLIAWQGWDRLKPLFSAPRQAYP